MSGKPTKKTFLPAAGQATAPSADETIPAAELQSSRAHAIKPSKAGERRTGYTWRQTADERDALDDLVKTAGRQLDRTIDKASVLAELVYLANENDAVFAELVAALQNGART